MTRFRDRIARLADRARAERAAFDPPADPPATERAVEYVRTGFGPLVSVYVEARTAGDPVRFTAEEHDLFHRGVNDWLALWAACHGIDADFDVTVREAAQLLVDTHDARETAELLTGVPER